jgi:hypothetical protein
MVSYLAMARLMTESYRHYLGSFYLLGAPTQALGVNDRRGSSTVLAPRRQVPFTHHYPSNEGVCRTPR